MKFLDSKKIEKKKGNIEIIFKAMEPLHQAALLGYNAEVCNSLEANDLGLNIQAQMKMASYALNEMIDSLIVDGETLDAKIVAACADISDVDTFNVLKNIYAITSDLLLEGYTKKKSSSPALPIKKDTAVQDAPGATKG